MNHPCIRIQLETEFAAVPSLVFTTVPSVLIAAIQTIAMREHIKAYSTSEAPSSSRVNDRINFFMGGANLSEINALATWLSSLATRL